MNSLQSDAGLPIPLFDRAPSDRFLAFQTEDLGEVQRYMSSVLCPHRLLSGRRKLHFHHYSAPMRELDFNWLSYGRLDCPVDMEAPNLADSYMIRLALSGQCELQVGRQSVLLTPGAAIIVNPDGPVRTRMEGEYEHLTIKVPRTAFLPGSRSGAGLQPADTARIRHETDVPGQRSWRRRQHRPDDL